MLAANRTLHVNRTTATVGPARDPDPARDWPCIGRANQTGDLPSRAGLKSWAAAVAGELAHIAAAAVAGDTRGNGRNATVDRAAYKLARYIGPLRLSDLYVELLTDRLLTAALATGLPEREARRARSADGGRPPR